MRTALDTNVVSAIWSAESHAYAIAQALLRARVEGPMVISAPVYAELLAYPDRTADLHRFVTANGIELDFELDKSIWTETGNRFARYSARRRRSKGAPPRRLLADFIIGAHALLRADRLMTLDVTRYRRDFPELRLITIP